MICKSKIFVIDLDGTLLNDSKEISEGMIKICEQLIENDYYIIIATGRAPTDSIQYYRMLGLETIMINYNGGLIWDPNSLQKYYSCYLKETRQIFEYLYNNFMAMGIQNILACSDENCYFYSKENVYLLELMKSSELKCQFIGKDIYKIQHCQRIIVSVEDSVVPKWILKLRYLFRNIDIYSWSDTINIIDISISRQHVSKWQALKRVLNNDQEYYIISIGDAHNDIEMMRNSSVGIAMANAEQDVKEVADYITEFDNNNDGIRNFMESNQDIWKNTILI